MNPNDILASIVFGGDGGGGNQITKVEELSTDGGASDAGKVLVVGDNGKIAASDLTVGEGEIAVDKGLTVNGAAADAKKTGDAIAELNGSLDDVKEHIGLPITRKLLTSDIQQASSDGVYDVDSSGNIIATTAPANSKNEVLIFKDAIKIDYDDSVLGGNGAKASRIALYTTTVPVGYMAFRFLTTGNYISGVHCLSSGGISGGGAVSGYTWNDSFGSGIYLKHVTAEKTGDGVSFKIIDTADVEHDYTIPYSALNGATYDTCFLGLGNFTVGASVVSDGRILARNVKVTIASADSEIDSNSPLYGKTWEVYGDSYSAPSGTTKYMDVISTNTGCTVNNYAVAGRRMSEIASEIPSGTTGNSLMTLFAGYNDYANSTNLIQFETDTKTVIDTLIARNINADIGIICTSQCGQAFDSTNYKSDPPYDCRKPNNENLVLEDYTNKLKEIAEEYGLPCLDLYHCGQVHVDRSDYLDTYFGDNGLHPKANQHLRFSKLILHWLENEVVIT